MLWLQIVVRGFWHPTGHLGDYYLAHGQPGRAVALQAQGLAMARYLGAPAPAADEDCSTARTWLNGDAVANRRPRLLAPRHSVTTTATDAAGMAGYSLACAQAQAGQPEQAARTLAEAIEANPDLRANASRDPDLRSLRESGRLEAIC